jgi:hypothetical protein
MERSISQAKPKDDGLSITTARPMPCLRQEDVRQSHVIATRGDVYGSPGTPYVLLTNRGSPTDRTCRKAISKNNNTERATVDFQQPEYKRIYIAVDSEYC